MVLLGCIAQCIKSVMNANMPPASPGGHSLGYAGDLWSSDLFAQIVRTIKQVAYPHRSSLTSIIFRDILTLRREEDRRLLRNGAPDFFSY